MNDVIVLDDVTKRYGRHTVLSHLSLSLPAGRIYGLLGENGVGKTTLLRLLADILKADSGRLYVAGQEVSRKTHGLVSFLPEPAQLYPFMRVKDALAYYSDFYGDFDAGKAAQLCHAFGLEPSAQVRRLSKGNQERVCLLLALCRRVPLYLLDEPVAGFDPLFKREFVQTLLENLDSGATVLLSSHLLRDLQSIFDDILLLTPAGVSLANAETLWEQGKSPEEYYMEVMKK